MKNIMLIATTTLLWAIPSYSMQYVAQPDTTPVGVVTIVDAEVEIEYLPEVTVEVIHSEVEINGIIEVK